MVFPKPRWDFQAYTLSDVYNTLENQRVDQMNTQWFFTFFVTELLKAPVILTKELQPPIPDLHDAYAPLVQQLVGVLITYKAIN